MEIFQDYDNWHFDHYLNSSIPQMTLLQLK